MLLKKVFVFQHYLKADGAKHEVIHIKNDDGECVFMNMYENSMVGRSLCVAHVMKGLADVLISNSSALLCAINRFDKMENHVIQSIKSR